MDRHIRLSVGAETRGLPVIPGKHGARRVDRSVAGNIHCGEAGWLDQRPSRSNRPIRPIEVIQHRRGRSESGTHDSARRARSRTAPGRIRRCLVHPHRRTNVSPNQQIRRASRSRNINAIRATSITTLPLITHRRNRTPQPGALRHTHRLPLHRRPRHHRQLRIHGRTRRHTHNSGGRARSRTAPGRIRRCLVHPHRRTNVSPNQQIRRASRSRNINAIRATSITTLPLITHRRNRTPQPGALRHTHRLPLHRRPRHHRQLRIHGRTRRHTHNSGGRARSRTAPGRIRRCLVHPHRRTNVSPNQQIRRASRSRNINAIRATSITTLPLITHRRNRTPQPGALRHTHRLPLHRRPRHHRQLRIHGRTRRHTHNSGGRARSRTAPGRIRRCLVHPHRRTNVSPNQQIRRASRSRNINAIRATSITTLPLITHRRNRTPQPGALRHTHRLPLHRRPRHHRQLRIHGRTRRHTHNSGGRARSRTAPGRIRRCLVHPHRRTNVSPNQQIRRASRSRNINAIRATSITTLPLITHRRNRTPQPGALRHTHRLPLHRRPRHHRQLRIHGRTRRRRDN